MLTQKNLQPAIEYANPWLIMIDCSGGLVVDEGNCFWDTILLNSIYTSYSSFIWYVTTKEMKRSSTQGKISAILRHLTWKVTNLSVWLMFKEIQKLMGSLLYLGRLDKSPYATFLSPNLWNDISYDFTSSCCSLLGLAYESPLYTSVTAGSLALPKHMKVAALLQSKNFKFQQVRAHTPFKCTNMYR
jgi:hypothetical protein